MGENLSTHTYVLKHLLDAAHTLNGLFSVWNRPICSMHYRVNILASLFTRQIAYYMGEGRIFK